MEGIEQIKQPTRSVIEQKIEGFLRLGKEIKITPKANVTINKPGYSLKHFTETVSLIIGIGNNHLADLVMNKDAWEALKAGESVHIETTEEYKKKFG